MLDLKVPLVLAEIKGFEAGYHGFLGFARIKARAGSIQLGENLTPIYTDDTDQKQTKLRLGGGMGGEAGFSAARLAKARAASVEMTMLWRFGNPRPRVRTWGTRCLMDHQLCGGGIRTVLARQVRMGPQFMGWRVLLRQTSTAVR